MKFWRNYRLLIGGFGFSNLGNWIYLVALNVYVLNLTDSAAAVAGIFIVGPIARIVASFFAGSLIDRANKRKLMIATDIIRGGLIIFLPFMQSIWLIYTVLFLTNIASSFFGPSSIYYITKYVKEEDRTRFNALLGTFNSGAFMVGPALSGALIYLFNPSIAIWVNSFTFFVCALIIFYLPDVDEKVENVREPLSLNMLKADFLTVMQFARQESGFITIYLVYQLALMIAFALDSQEVTFIKQNLGASESIYGLIVSLTGIGAISGGLLAAALVSKFSLKSYISVGFSLTMIFYTVFYASSVLWLAITSFILLGFFMAFSNAGYDTFYQKSVPPELMGRFGSVGLILTSTVQILFTFLLGIFAEVFTLQPVAVLLGSIGVLLALILSGILYTKQRAVVNQ
ncbi:MFS transporter [Lysinibacillus sp. 3P01SB]|uniref:MFS transporter n=1 Tax=Lysinibacillus sp. 3P01SB TaxID=3132284 RepID=UPI0039A571DF